MLGVGTTIHYSLICLKSNKFFNILGTWSQCSANCNRGIRSRSRACPVLNACAGPAFEQENCNEQPCSTTNVGSWTQWQVNSEQQTHKTVLGLIGPSVQYLVAMVSKEEHVLATRATVPDLTVKRPHVPKPSAQSQTLNGVVSPFYVLTKMSPWLENHYLATFPQDPTRFNHEKRPK